MKKTKEEKEVSSFIQFSRSEVVQDLESERVIDTAAVSGSADHVKIIQPRDAEDSLLKPEKMAKTIGVSFFTFY
jgi:hypothetical protein